MTSVGSVANISADEEDVGAFSNVADDEGVETKLPRSRYGICEGASEDSGDTGEIAIWSRLGMSSGMTAAEQTTSMVCGLDHAMDMDGGQRSSWPR